MATSPVRMPAGINNVNYTVSPLGAAGESNYNGARNSHPLFMFPQQDPFRLVVEAHDFVETPNAASYVSTVVGTGATTFPAGLGGIMQLTTSAGATDSVAWQHSSADMAYTSTQQEWFHTLVTPSDATAAEYILGMLNVTTTPGSATDGFYFHKASGATAIDLVIKNASAVFTIAGIGNMADATPIKLSLYYDGRGTLNYYINNNKVGFTTNTAAFPLSTVALSSSFYILNAAAAIKNIKVDYYLAAAEMVR